MKGTERESSTREESGDPNSLGPFDLREGVVDGAGAEGAGSGYYTLMTSNIDDEFTSCSCRGTRRGMGSRRR